MGSIVEGNIGINEPVIVLYVEVVFRRPCSHGCPRLWAPGEVSWLIYGDGCRVTFLSMCGEWVGGIEMRFMGRGSWLIF